MIQVTKATSKTNCKKKIICPPTIWRPLKILLPKVGEINVWDRTVPSCKFLTPIGMRYLSLGKIRFLPRALPWGATVPCYTFFRKLLSSWFLPRDAMQARSMLSCSVRLSVTFVDHVKTNKHILEFFSPSGSDTILVFPSHRRCRYSDGNPPNGGVECKGVW